MNTLCWKSPATMIKKDTKQPKTLFHCILSHKQQHIIISTHSFTKHSFNTLFQKTHKIENTLSMRYFNTVSNINLQAGKGAQKFLCFLSGLEALPLVWEHLPDISPTWVWLAKLEVAHLFVTAKKTFCGTVGMSESRQPSGISVSVDSVHLIIELTSFLWLSQHHSRSIGLLYAYTGTNN